MSKHSFIAVALACIYCYLEPGCVYKKLIVLRTCLEFILKFIRLWNLTSSRDKYSYNVGPLCCMTDALEPVSVFASPRVKPVENFS